MKIFIIINGTETQIEAKKSMTIRDIAKIALMQTEDCLRPKKQLGDWNLYGEHRQLNMDKTLGEQLNLLKNRNLAFMTIRAGIGA